MCPFGEINCCPGFDWHTRDKLAYFLVALRYDAVPKIGMLDVPRGGLNQYSQFLLRVDLAIHLTTLLFIIFMLATLFCLP